MKLKNIIKSAVKAKVATAKAKAKAKVAAKLASKASAKCKGGKCCDGGKCKTCAVALALIIAATLCGCGTVTPSRSQTLTLKDCTINIYGSGNGMTNDVARVEIASQAMSIENSGTETQTATPQYTTDVKPDVDLNYNGPTKTASDGVGGIVDAVANAVSGDDCPDCKDK